MEVVYVIAIYWVITTLTTVGYGDFKGYTAPEYLFQIIVEFVGIVLFSFLMNLINGFFVMEKTLQDLIDDRNEEIELWLRNLDSRRTKNFSRPIVDCIKTYTR